jgi:hypothetical protein
VQRARTGADYERGCFRVVNTDSYGTTIYFRMELKQQGEKQSGNFDGDKLEGTLKGISIYFLAKDEQGGTDEGKATVQGGTVTGTVVFTHADDAAHPGRRTSLRRNSFRRGGRGRRSGMNSRQPLFTGNFRRPKNRC